MCGGVGVVWVCVDGSDVRLFQLSFLVNPGSRKEDKV